MQQMEQPKQPFFANFLENQNRKTSDNQHGITKPWLDVMETHKYPSDSDEGGEPA